MTAAGIVTVRVHRVDLRWWVTNRVRGEGLGAIAK